MPQLEKIELACRCGAVKGFLSDVSPGSSNHCICLCDDCQAYGRFLGDNQVLDANGGTELTQVGHRQVTFTQGRDQIACVRLKPKGMHRWYASCCKTPLANTLGPKSLFAGVVHTCIQRTASGAPVEAALGPIRERVQGKFGKGQLPPGTPQTISFGFALHVFGRVFQWWLTGAATPSTFFAKGAPIVTPVVLTLEQRRALMRD